MVRVLIFVVFVVTWGQTVQAQQWVSLFDGKSLAGWQANESPDSWGIEDGAIVTGGNRSHLFYVGNVANHEFKNFEFSAEVKTNPGSNSGIYIHTKFQDSGWPEAGYELQVINSNAGEGGYVENKLTGSVYAIRNNWVSPVSDGEWFEYRILVSGKTIQTFINGKLTCQYTEPENTWRPNDKKGRLLGSGTFAIQAHDPGSIVHYRNLKVRLLADDAQSLGNPIADAELDQLITQLSNDNYPLIDFGISSETDTLAESARFYGVTLADSYPSLSFSGTNESVVVVNDSKLAPSVDFLKSAKAAGAKIAFSSGGATQLSAERLKARLTAIGEAGLDWQDFWIPAK